MENEIINAIMTRRTVREYKDIPLTDVEIKTLLDCAMWAPSARNAQHCVIRVIKDKDTLDKLNLDFKKTVGFDTPAYTRWDKNPVYQNAPALFLIFADTNALLDAGIMVENIAIAAKGLGLESCIIGSIGELFNSDKAASWKQRLDIDESSLFMISIAVGHGNEAPMPKERKPENFKIIK